VAAATRRAGATTLAAVRRLDDRTLHQRVFAPAAGIAEDPGTGSAAGRVAVLARQLWATDREVTVLQGAEVGRPCRIEVFVEDGSPQVGGRVAACAEGRFTL
jgi:trans-2,3-dihydro-3-hydroxyanthranilate isomerase